MEGLFENVGHMSMKVFSVKGTVKLIYETNCNKKITKDLPKYFF